MGESKRDTVCPECGCDRGHRLGCKTGNHWARRYQDKLERDFRKNGRRSTAPTEPGTPET